MVAMDKLVGASPDVRPESVLVVRVELVDSEPEIWRQLEVAPGATAARNAPRLLVQPDGGRPKTTGIARGWR